MGVVCGVNSGGATTPKKTHRLQWHSVKPKKPTISVVSYQDRH